MPAAIAMPAICSARFWTNHRTDRREKAITSEKKATPATQEAMCTQSMSKRWAKLKLSDELALKDR